MSEQDTNKLLEWNASKQRSNVGLSEGAARVLHVGRRHFTAWMHAISQDDDGSDYQVDYKR